MVHMGSDGLVATVSVRAHSGDADHRFRQADRGFQAMPITLEERSSASRCRVGRPGGRGRKPGTRPKTRPVVAARPGPSISS